MIDLKERCKSLVKIPESKKRKDTTEYTGLIKSMADLVYWASVPDFKCHCERCKKGIREETKKYNKGFCDNCIVVMMSEKRCFVCFEKITGKRFYHLGDVCQSCGIPVPIGGNHHGYKEGGVLSGGLRTNYYGDNQNDNSTKIYEQ